MLHNQCSGSTSDSPSLKLNSDHRLLALVFSSLSALGAHDERYFFNSNNQKHRNAHKLFKVRGQRVKPGRGSCQSRRSKEQRENKQIRESNNSTSHVGDLAIGRRMEYRNHGVDKEQSSKLLSPTHLSDATLTSRDGHESSDGLG